MASRFLTTLGLAHQIHEGFYPGSISSRQNNPGNIRFNESLARFYGAIKGDSGFARFPTYQAGFKALLDDISAKICGKSRHIDYSKNPTFLTYVKVYAPTEDNNNPLAYCEYLCSRLLEYGVRPETPLSQMCQLVNGQVPEPVVNISPEAKLKGLERRLENTENPSAKNVILGVIGRLKKRFT